MIDVATCRSCDKEYNENGDGWDSECPDCADKRAERESEDENQPCRKCGDTENWLFENFLFENYLCTDCDPRTNPDHRTPFPKQ